MILKAIKNDEQRKRLKGFHYVVTAFETEDEKELYLSIADKNQLLILSHGDLKRVFNRVRGLLWDNVEARRAYALKTNGSRKEYQRKWYKKNKTRLNADRRLKRRGLKPDFAGVNLT